MPMDEKNILQLAVEQGWLKPAQLGKLHSDPGNRLGASCPVSTWQLIPILMQSGDLTLEQLEALTAKMTVNALIGEEEKETPPIAPSGRPDGLPGSRTERYSIEEFLGAGGMSQVYKAYDHTLQRYVALKKFKTIGTELPLRFLREARLQARVHHDNICQVFDIGLHQGQWYIAMSYIPGRTLKQLAGELRLEEKVKLVQEAAEALHAAHQLGLVHRDVKPANIMVETVEDGRLKPYVTDFGLVRDLNHQDMTLTHDLVGSPQYMAPEQLLEDGSQIDRRIDVYSLGVTLYELLSGTLPFQGITMANIAVQILQQEAKPLRQVAPAVPSNLEAIVRKCLEKDPDQRYDTAKELAEDLERFLNSESILARCHPMMLRWLKKIKKNKSLAGKVIVALVLALVLAGLWLQDQRRDQAMTVIADRFGQDAQEIVTIMHRAFLVPPHNIRPERQRVREKMEEIGQRMKKLGQVADGPGNYALGQGYLTLQDYLLARMHLELAMAEGFQGSEVTQALSATLGELYREELDKAERIPEEELQDEVKKYLESEYVQPALRMLRAVKSDPTRPVVYTEAQVAFYEKRYPDALEKLSNIENIDSRFYEVKVLKGDIHKFMGDEYKVHLEISAALKEYELGVKAYEEAITCGGSDPRIYLLVSHILEKMARLQLNQKGNSITDLINKALFYCECALCINSELHRAFTSREGLYLIRGWSLLIENGRIPKPITNHRLDLAQKAKTLQENDDQFFLYH